MKILLIEDEPFIDETVKLFLKSKGHHVTSARDGQSGMDSFMRSINECNLFDLVITDYRMPLKDGAQVIREISAIKPVRVPRCRFCASPVGSILLSR